MLFPSFGHIVNKIYTLVSDLELLKLINWSWGGGGQIKKLQI